MKISYGFALMLISALALSQDSLAKTENGNDLARNFTYEENAREKNNIRSDAIGNLFYFRYLRIIEMEEGLTNRVSYIRIETIEPSSDMYVNFTVVKSVSKDIIQEQDIQIGDGIGVTGRVKTMDTDNGIYLEPVIVKHKDKLQPVKGKELLVDIMPDATYYSYTGAGRDKMVVISGKDRDLLPDSKERKKMIEEMGEQGFADYMLKKLAERNAERSKAKAGNIKPSAPAQK